ncbi:Hsp70 family protein [Dictyobacter arantiisoli]|uniref:Molecular chaperone DnaK n=1 Tax=Dictyobacter arantiisoli TaxID=2014874 RepID=A0A5A5TCM7_9CHLR|nr:Hsp70 family protein [Dictyobacter arantiisoli]GCF08704.1 molecular chaperone DnaK [Dictyobacter arantiisoli]
MSDQTVSTVFGIDLGTTYSCIAYVDEFGKPVVIANMEGDLTTPSVVQFEDESRIVGKEAKNSAVLAPAQVCELVKRHMGENEWRFNYNGFDYTPEEISSYILRKLADDAEQATGIPVKDVVITCPAYFGIAERDATTRAGEIANFNVREIINEPTAAAVTYGLQNEQDQVVLVYDLGGGTFDITVIEIKNGAITVVATGGDHTLGGRNWDEAVVGYLADQWMAEAASEDDPGDNEETLQDLWMRAEVGKHALTARKETNVVVTHASKRIGIPLSREKFDELTSSLLEQTIAFTNATIQTARARGYDHFDQILLVGGSSKMLQVAERLKAEFSIPVKMFDPDQAVAKGAAVYGRKLAIDEKITIKVAELTGQEEERVDLETVSTTIKEQAQQEVARDSGLKLHAVKKYNDMSVTNVASHSFGIIALDPRTHEDIIYNLVLANDQLPAHKTENFYTEVAEQETVELKVLENKGTENVLRDLTLGEEIGNAVLHLPSNLPVDHPIEVTFNLNREGRLHIVGREPVSNVSIEIDIETARGITPEEAAEAKKRSSRLVIS